MATARASQFLVEAVQSPTAVDARVTQFYVEAIGPLVADPVDPDPDPDPEPTDPPPTEAGIRWAIHRFDMKYRIEESS